MCIVFCRHWCLTLYVVLLRMAYFLNCLTDVAHSSDLSNLVVIALANVATVGWTLSDFIILRCTYVLW